MTMSPAAILKWLDETIRRPKELEQVAMQHAGLNPRQVEIDWTRWYNSVSLGDRSPPSIQFLDLHPPYKHGRAAVMQGPYVSAPVKVLRSEIRPGTTTASLRGMVAERQEEALKDALKLFREELDKRKAESKEAIDGPGTDCQGRAEHRS